MREFCQELVLAGVVEIVPDPNVDEIRADGRELQAIYGNGHVLTQSSSEGTARVQSHVRIVVEKALEGVSRSNAEVCQVYNSGITYSALDVETNRHSQCRNSGAGEECDEYDQGFHAFFLIWATCLRQTRQKASNGSASAMSNSELLASGTLNSFSSSPDAVSVSCTSTMPMPMS